MKIQFFWIHWDLFYGPGYSLSWHLFCGHLRRMYILLLLGGVFCKCWLDSVGWWCCWVILYPCWLPSYFINFERGVLKSANIIVDLCIFLFSSIRFRFTYFVSLLFGACEFRISWWINPSSLYNIPLCAHFGGTYTKIGTIQRRLAWPLCKDDTQIHEAVCIFVKMVVVILSISNSVNNKNKVKKIFLSASGNFFLPEV